MLYVCRMYADCLQMHTEFAPMELLFNSNVNLRNSMQARNPVLVVPQRESNVFNFSKKKAKRHLENIK